MGLLAACTTVFFDLDDTLIAQDDSDREAFSVACGLAQQRYGVDAEALCARMNATTRALWRSAPTFTYAHRIGISATEGLWARFTGDDANLQALRVWAPEYRRQAWSTALRDLGYNDPADVEALVTAFAAARRARHVVFADTLPVLRLLQGRYRIGLVTNGAPDLQREKLRGSGLEGFLDAVIVSGEVGVGKPDPAIFTAALSALSARPEATVMVGDNPGRDIDGATASGITAILVERPGLVRTPGTATPHARIDTLEALPALLSSG